MADFSGSYDHGLDSKGRVIIPMCFREGLGENFTIALNGLATAIALYPQDQWEHVKNRLARVSNTDAMGMDYKSFFIGNAFTSNSIDAQGRVLLPSKLRNMIGITKDVVFVGMTETIEIWDATTHNEKEQQARVDIKSLLQHMEDKY